MLGTENRCHGGFSPAIYSEGQTIREIGRQKSYLVLHVLLRQCDSVNGEEIQSCTFDSLPAKYKDAIDRTLVLFSNRIRHWKLNSNLVQTSYGLNIQTFYSRTTKNEYANIQIVIKWFYTNSINWFRKLRFRSHYRQFE